MSRLHTFFKQLTQEGGSGNFLIINLKNQAYLQFASENGSKKIYCEASGNQLNTNQTAALLNLGWKAPDSGDLHKNFSQEFKGTDSVAFDQLEQLIQDTATTVYQTDKELFTYELNLQ